MDSKQFDSSDPQILEDLMFEPVDLLDTVDVELVDSDDDDDEVFGGELVKSMGACCSAGARDRQDATTMPQPQPQDRPRSGLGKLQSLRYQVRSKPPAADSSNSSLTADTTHQTTPLITDNQRDENSNSPAASVRSQRSADGNANVTSTAMTSSAARFGFGFKRPQNVNSRKTLDRDSGKGSVESLEVKSKVSGRITPASSTGSLNTKPAERKPLVTKGQIGSKTNSPKSSASSLNSQRSASPQTTKTAQLRAPAVKSSGLVKPAVQKTAGNTSNNSVLPSGPVKATQSVLKDNKDVSRQDEVGYRSSRLPAHARGPYLSRLQSQAQKATEPYSTSLPRSQKQRDQNNKAMNAQKPGDTTLAYSSRTTAVPTQLSFGHRKSLDMSKNTPDSMTESIFNPEAPLATFDSLGSTSFMSQISMASDDMILDFEDFDHDSRGGFTSVASTPGDDKNIEREFLTNNLARKARSKSIEAPKKNKVLSQSPLVIDSTDKADDSAYMSGSSEKFEITVASSTMSAAPTCPLSPVLDVSTDTASLEDADKTLSSSSLECSTKSPLHKQQRLEEADNGNIVLSQTITRDSKVDFGKESKGCHLADEADGQEVRMRYRTRPRAATLQELSELIHDTSPSKDPLVRTRSLSSPLRPPRPRSVSGVDDEETVEIDAHTYRQTLQDITALKTLLHKLKRCLHEEDLSLTDVLDHRRGLHSAMYGSEGSLLDETPLRRKHSQRSNPGDRSQENSPRERHPSCSEEQDMSEENYNLRQELAALRRDVEEKDHTIHLLQQQMTKYETEQSARNFQSASTQTDSTPSMEQNKPPTNPSNPSNPESRPRLARPSTLPQPKLGQSSSSSVSDILAEISRKSSEKASAFRRKLSGVETSLSDVTGNLRQLTMTSRMRRGHSMTVLSNGTS